MTKAYQLTSYPVGTKREFWAMSWPLMLAMISTTLMMFVDRLFLSRYNPLALNAAATSGIAYYMFLVLPVGIVSISEVLVGRLHGESRFHEVGAAVWQMVWFSLCLTPLFFLIAELGPRFLFNGTGIETLETTYFKTLLGFAFLQCMTIAFSGFFIGIGKVKVVTISAILGNLINISLDWILIFGWGEIPALGILGAALATGFSQLIQAIFLLCMILRRKERTTYQTGRFSFSPHFLIEGLKIGTPSGLGHTVEVIAHFLFFRFVMSVGQAQMTIVAVVQSLYILFSFVNDSGSKAASAIVSNLLGAEVRSYMKKVLFSSFTLQVFYFLLFVAIVLVFPDFWTHLFLSKGEMISPEIKTVFVYALSYMTLFFLFDGLSWILIGFLTASGDTRFIFWTSLIVHWGAYVLPTLFFIGVEKGGADTAWAIVAGMSLLNLSIYLFRYLSGTWLKKYQRI